MATVGIWKIKKRLDVVIDYTTDKNKTSDYEYADLHRTLNYTQADHKTEEQLYVSALNCSVNTAFKEMSLTKKYWKKEGDVLGYHCFQSFKGREATPEQAHEIGLKFAEEIWGDRFEVTVSTHLNTNNIHNHFVINSVSFKDGKKYYDNRTSYARLREVSNAICEEYGLHFLKEKVCRKSGINYASYYENYKEHNNYYTDTKKDLDTAIKQAYSYKDFENIMKSLGYQLIYRAGKLSVRKEPYKKNIRVHRAFGEEYIRENIEKKIKEEYLDYELLEVEDKYKVYEKQDSYKKAKSKGVYGLYLHYCYLLKVFPTKYPRKILSPEIRADIKIMEAISNQTVWLAEKKIASREEFKNKYKTTTDKLSDMCSKRENLWRKYNSSTSEQEQIIIRNQIDILSNDIKDLRKEVVICEEIAERLDIVVNNIEQHYNQGKRKER